MMNSNKTQLQQHKKTPLYYFGILLLLVALGASLVLAGTKLGFLAQVPGCGPNSGCEAVTSGPWGSVPIVNWPISFVGVAWFASLFCVWAWRGATLPHFVWVIRIGVLASIGFFILMFSIGHFCKWCALAHVANIVFWVVAEVGCKMAKNSSACSEKNSAADCPILPVTLLFILFSAILGITQFSVSSYAKQREQIAGEENVQKIVEGGSGDSTLRLLEASHRIGPENAAVQVVIFTDYQCPDCKRIEGELASIVASRSDVSVSVKHFPLCYDCNDNIGNFKLHANACWAARAAEAASIVGGEEGWERMHKWLFEQSGRFTDQTFSTDLVNLGFDPRDFVPVMMSDVTLQRVKSESNDGFALGVYYTPMVFINGVEYLWYYGRRDSLATIVDSVAKNIAAGGSKIKAPPNASEKLVEDWRVGKTFDPPGHSENSWLGNGPIEFVVWGDYQAPLSVQLDAEVQKLIQEENSKIRYSFRNFPIDESCNAGVANMPTKYNGSCNLSKLVESVSVLGGSGPRWKMHDWILAQPKPVNLGDARTQAAILAGVDEATIEDVVGSIDVGNRMRLDIMSKNLVWRKAIPVITIDGRFVPRWRSEAVPAPDVFHRIIDAVESEGNNK